jgi:hypothetical protein
MEVPFQMDSDRDRFISTASELEKLIATVIDDHASSSKAIGISTARALESLIDVERSLVGRDETTAVIITNLERHSSLLNEILTEEEVRTTAFQIRFDEGLVQCVELKVKAFTHISSYLERLTILGIGSLGLSVTMLGFLYTRTTSQHPVSHISFAFISWFFLFCSILVAAMGQLQFTQMSHDLLHKVSDTASAKLLQDSARAYRQQQKNESENAKNDVNSIAEGEIDDEQISPVRKQSGQNSRKAVYTTVLIGFGFFFLLLFVVSNSGIFAASK